MVIATTAGIKISVKNFFRPEFSDLRKRHYLFSYQIQIENQSGYAVQLLRRHWHIFDSSGEYSEAEGAGVVGLQPVLRPNDIHEYESACNLTTEMGKMHGTYLMQRKSDGSTFEVEIPSFEMFASYRMN